MINRQKSELNQRVKQLITLDRLPLITSLQLLHIHFRIFLRYQRRLLRCRFCFFLTTDFRLQLVLQHPKFLAFPASEQPHKHLVPMVIRRLEAMLELEVAIGQA